MPIHGWTKCLNWVRLTHQWCYRNCQIVILNLILNLIVIIITIKLLIRFSYKWFVVVQLKTLTKSANELAVDEENGTR